MKTSRVSRLTAVSVLAPLAVLAFLTGCDPVEPPPRAPIPVTVVQVENPAEANAARYSGTVEPAVTVPVAFRTSGYVRDLGVAEGFDGTRHTLQSGDRIASGDFLARIEDREYASRLARSRSGISEARAGLAAAQAQVESARAVARQAASDFERARRLLAAESVTRVEFDQAETRSQTAARALAAAEAASDAAQARVRAAGEAAGEIESVAGDTTLRASLSGIVLRRNVEVGTLVGPGTVGFVLGETDKVKLTFAVPDRFLGRIQLGATLSAFLDALPAEHILSVQGDQTAISTGSSTGQPRSTGFPGTVTRIAAAADPLTRLFEIELRLPNPDGKLKPGMIAAVELDPAHEPRVGLIPLEAVVPAGPGGRSFAVFSIETHDGKTIARRREVQLGRPVGNRIALLDGVAPGDRIVAAGAALLEDGDAIQPVEPMH